jgi:hypothetical protein
MKVQLRWRRRVPLRIRNSSFFSLAFQFAFYVAFIFFMGQ